MRALVLLLAACGPPEKSAPTTPPSPTAPTVGTQTGTGIPGGTTSPADPDEVVLQLVQIELSSNALGEAALLRTPSGESVLIDVGNDQHADQVVAAVEAAGLGNTVDWLILTHYHADHIGAVDELFGPSGDLQVAQGIVWRGDVSTGDANATELAELIDVVASGVPDVPLCDGTGCGALPWSVPFGEGELTVFVADGEVGTDTGVVRVGAVDDEENAHSLAGIVSFGTFDFVFGGDLTGGGKDTPDIESAVAALGPQIASVPAGEVDLVKLNHHGISSSTSVDWAAWLLGQGRTTNALVGATGAYLDAPSEEALDVVRPHLGSGRVWVNTTGLLGGSDPILTEIGGSVLVEVERDGDYAIGSLDGAIREIYP